MSVIDIRHYLTTQIDKLDDQSQLTSLLKAVRSACREFLDSTENKDSNLRFYSRNYESWEISIALGEMRRTFGYCISQIILIFELDIEKDLASILSTGYSD
jgi:hypothetical protein